MANSQDYESYLDGLVDWGRGLLAGLIDLLYGCKILQRVSIWMGIIFAGSDANK